METFEPGKHEGLLAITTDTPGMSLCVRVYEETKDGGAGEKKEFVVHNKQLIKDRSARSSRWSIRLIPLRYWTLKTQLVIVNERSTNEALVQKLYNLGPLAVAQTFD